MPDLDGVLIRANLSIYALYSNTFKSVEANSEVALS